MSAETDCVIETLKQWESYLCTEPNTEPGYWDGEKEACNKNVTHREGGI